MDLISQLGAAAGLVGLSVMLWAMTPNFMTPSNLLNVLLQSSINGVLAVGMTLVILTGGIDLSVGSVLALSGIGLGHLLQNGAGAWVAVAGALAVAAAAGLVNGLLITRAKLPPFIATLGMMSAARGLALVWSAGHPISGFAADFQAIAGTGSLIAINLATYALCLLVLSRTTFGRYVYAIGGNEQAAWLSGVPTARLTTIVYTLCGLSAGIGAVMLTARLNSAQPIAGVNYELDAIAAVVIGGTSLNGGEGSVVGTLIGVLIMSVLRNGLNLLSVSADMQQVIIGVVIVVAVLVDRMRVAPPRWWSRVGTGRAVAVSMAGFALLLGWSWSYRTGHQTGSGPRLAVLPKTLNNPFWIDLVNAARQAADRLHVSVVVQAPDRETDSERQMQIVENLIQEHVTAIILAPCGSKEIVPAVKEANEAHIPVLIVDTRVDEATLKAAGAHIETFIGSDNRKGGQLAGDALAQAMHESGDVAVIEGFAGHETGDARKGGFMDAMQHHPGLHVVASQPADWEQEKAYDVTQNILQAHPSIKGIFTCNDVMGMGSLAALKAAGRKDILLMGFDASADARKAIADGTMLGSVAQYPGEMGRIAVESAMQVLNGQKLDAYIPTKVEVIDKSKL